MNTIKIQLTPEDAEIARRQVLRLLETAAPDAITRVLMASVNDMSAAPAYGQARVASGFTEQAKRELAAKRKHAEEQAKEKEQIDEAYSLMAEQVRLAAPVGRSVKELTVGYLKNDCRFFLDIRYRSYRLSSSYSRYGQELVVEVGDYGYGAEPRRQTYRRRDGGKGFNWPKIADRFWSELLSREAKDKRETAERATLKASGNLAEEVKAAAGVAPNAYDISVIASRFERDKVRVAYRLDRDMTPAEAQALIAALQGIGLVKKA